MINSAKAHWFPILVSLIALVGVATLYTFQRSAYAGALTKNELRTYSRFAAFEYEIFIEQSRHLLSVLSTLPQVNGGNSSLCNTTLSPIAENSDQYINIGVANLDGVVTCSAIANGIGVDLSEREFFKRTTESKLFSVGEYGKGAITGVPNITFGYPLKDSSGELKGVIFAGVDLRWLAQFSVRAGLPGGSVITLVDDKGTTLARYPDLGTTGSEAPEVSFIFERLEFLDQGLGVIEASDASSDSYYIVAVPLKRDLQEGFLHLIISIPKSNLDILAATHISELDILRDAE